MIGKQLDMFEERKKQEQELQENRTTHDVGNQQLEIPYNDANEELVDGLTQLEREVIAKRTGCMDLSTIKKVDGIIYVGPYNETEEEWIESGKPSGEYWQSYNR